MAREPLERRFAASPGGTVEESIRWAAEKGFRCVVFTTDAGPNSLTEWPEKRAAEVRRTAEGSDIRLVIHTLSAVNVAEFVPYMREAVDQYLGGNVDLAGRLGADIIVHAGMTFRERFDVRKQASLDHLSRAATRAGALGVKLYLENMNREPERAEVHYLGETSAEMRELLEPLDPATVKWAFSANHAQLVPEKFDGFIDALGVDRIGIVMVADCRGEYEEHLLPGQGNLDFARLFTRLEAAGYGGFYLLTFGPKDDTFAGRTYILDQLQSAAAV